MEEQTGTVIREALGNLVAGSLLLTFVFAGALLVNLP